MTDHHFGGIWTQIKLMALEKYMAAYTQVLQNQNLTLHYVDAFAGTGRINYDNAHHTAAGIEPLFDSPDSVRGSAQIALDSGGFHHYHFNDLKQAHVDDLEKIKARHPDKSITVSRQDANAFLQEFCQQMRWNDRALIFIDPYACSVKWETLAHLSETKKVDIWLLFPFSSLVRLLPNDIDKIPPQWESKITDMLGTNDWRAHLYKPNSAPESRDLFGHLEAEQPTHARLNVAELTEYLTTQLRGIFPLVEGPAPLMNSKNQPLFHFYFAAANPKPQATIIASRIAKSVIKQALQRRF